MLVYAVWSFGVAGLGGLGLAYLRIGKDRVSLPLALGHGLFAATGLALLAYAYVQAGTTPITFAFAIFNVAALAGLSLFAFHLRSRPLPILLVFLHGGLAVMAFVVLLLTVTLNLPS